MNTYEKVLVAVAAWTFFEGLWVAAFPRAAAAVVRKLFPKLGAFLHETPPNELRKLGAIEMIFGLFLGIYLLIALN